MQGICVTKVSTINTLCAWLLPTELQPTTGDGRFSLPFNCFYLKTIILPVVLYGCETWSLTLREERRLRVFENRVLRKIFGPKGDEVTGEWRRLHNEGLHDLYS
jgi:hypothetical protein